MTAVRHNNIRFLTNGTFVQQDRKTRLEFIHARFVINPLRFILIRFVFLLKIKRVAVKGALGEDQSVPFYLKRQVTVLFHFPAESDRKIT